MSLNSLNSVKTFRENSKDFLFNRLRPGMFEGLGNLMHLWFFSDEISSIAPGSFQVDDDNSFIIVFNLNQSISVMLSYGTVAISTATIKNSQASGL